MVQFSPQVCLTLALMSSLVSGSSSGGCRPVGIGGGLLRIVARCLLCLVSLGLQEVPLPQVRVIRPFLRVFQLTLGVQVRWDEIWTVPVHDKSTARPKSSGLPGR